MKPRLYYFFGSPFVWRAQLALEHKGVDYALEKLDPGADEQRSEAYLRLNPRGKVPTLVDGDVTLYESAAIVEYVEERFPDGPSLFPASLGERARVRRLIVEMDQYYWPGGWLLAENLYFKQPADWDLEAIERGRQILVHELGHFEGQMRDPGLAGALGAADYALYPLLAHIARYELRRPELKLSEQIGPKTRAMMDAIEALPQFERTYPPHWRK